MSEKIGPTGEFPHGKLNEHDEGQLQLRIGNAGGTVIIEFGTTVAWLGLDPQGAADFASTIIKHAREAANEAGVEFTVSL